MLKAARVLYYLGLGLSALVGLWHFFVPYLYRWYDYIPAQYENLIVGIDWTNFCFSMLLMGLSLLLIAMGNKVFKGQGELLTIYGFLVFVWMGRVAVALINPWPLEPIAWAAYAQLAGAIAIFVIQLIPLLVLVRERKRLREKHQ
jgi:hypothetical protein